MIHVCGFICRYVQKHGTGRSAKDLNVDPSQKVTVTFIAKQSVQQC